MILSKIQELEKKFHQQILQRAGIHKEHLEFDDVLKIPLWKAIKHRIPWLIIGLLGGLLAAQIISYFEVLIEKNIILAAFIPLVVYIADAVGTQLEALTIRDFALSEKFNFLKYFLRQFIVVLIIAVLLGGIITGISYFLYEKISIALVLGFAIVAASLSSLFSGLFIPFLFKKINFDPADASGPIGTIIQDLLSVLIYFAIANWLLP